MEIDLVQLGKFSISNLHAVKEMLVKEQDNVYKHAKAYCDLHWTNIREEAPAKENPRYLTRVRVLSHSLQCVWLSAGTAPRLGKEGSVIAKQLPKGTGRNNPYYKKSTFNAASNWEREIIDETERQYALQRERYSILTENIKKIEKLIELTEMSYRDIELGDDHG